MAKIAADVREGARRDAVLFAVGANAAHGLKRTNRDKRNAVMVLLKAPEWAQWSDREIARRCLVGADMVGAARRQGRSVELAAARTEPGLVGVLTHR